MLTSPSDMALVVTSISAPNAVLASLAAGAAARQVSFLVIGDSKSPPGFALDGCDFYDLARQRALPFAYAKACQERSYTRKNIGYLAAIHDGAKVIIETDDDNFPRIDFWAQRNRLVTGDAVAIGGWLNAYHYFSNSPIYPRGLPLEHVRPPGLFFPPRQPVADALCPIQQGLADANPDVDAIYRMLYPLPLDFDQNAPLVLGPGTWCPFNSQNTTTFREAFPLLYLPTYCSFRMTDIWRSFVAQRIGWTCGWRIAFHASTVYQERNEHDLLKDFADEVPGYLNNARIGRALDALELSEGESAIAANMRRCYEELVRLEVVKAEELGLLDLWLDDLSALS